MAPTARTPGKVLKDERVQLSASRSLLISQSLVEPHKADEFQAVLNHNEVRLSVFFSKMSKTEKVRLLRSIIHPALGHSGCLVKTFSTLPDLTKEPFSDNDDFRRILEVLQAQLDLPFVTSYANRLGSFECFALHTWLEEISQF
jgi:hypothetical protein